MLKDFFEAIKKVPQQKLQKILVVIYLILVTMQVLFPNDMLVLKDRLIKPIVNSPFGDYLFLYEVLMHSLAIIGAMAVVSYILLEIFSRYLWVKQIKWISEYKTKERFLLTYVMGSHSIVITNWFWILFIYGMTFNIPFYSWSDPWFYMFITFLWIGPISAFIKLTNFIFTSED